MTRYGVDPATFLHLARHGTTPHPAHRLVAPTGLRSRALALLLTEVRSGELDEREALAVHERLTTLRVRLLGDRVSRRVAWDLACRFDWPDLDDAECLAVAMLQADALLTLDARLAARAGQLVRVASPPELVTG